jgi:enoyl-CoA hydratase
MSSTKEASNDTNRNVLINVYEKVAVITINRPKRMNALNRETLEDLYEILKSINSNDNIRAVVITGAGDKAFIAGADITDMAKRSAHEAKQASERGCEIFSFIENMKAPVIAAINGYALGGGCELALACDLRIAGKRAKIGQPEIKIGIIPGYGGVFRLPRLIGMGRAKEMIYRGTVIGAEEAEKIGLINKAIEDDKLMEEVMALAKELANGPNGLSIAKSAIGLSFTVSNKKANDITIEFYKQAFSTKDCEEGINAFLENRSPAFEWK